MNRTVPGDHPSLADALAAAQPGDVIELTGTHEVPLTPLHGVTLTGGVLRGTGPGVIRLHAGSGLHDLRIENPGGHGVIVREGSPIIQGVTLNVTGTAIACGWDVSPRIENVRVEACQIGVTAQDTAAPLAEDLVLTSSGTGLFLTGEAAGTWTQVAIAAGQMAAVEIAQKASPTLVSVAIAAAGRGGFFVHGTSTPKLHGCVAQRCGLAGLEVTGQADPTVDGLLVQDGQGGGVFLHGRSRGTYLELEVRRSALASLEIGEEARPEIERAVLADSQAGGVWVHGEAVVELIDVSVTDCTFQAVEASDTAQVKLEECRLEGSQHPGILARDKAQLGLVGTSITGGSDWAIVAQDAARMTIEGGKILDNRGGVARAEGAAVVVFDAAVETKGTRETAGAGVIHQLD